MLFTPGPVEVHPEVIRAGAGPVQHHRSRAFIDRSVELWQMLPPLFRTERPVVVQAGSAMTGLESAMACLHPRGRTIAVFSHGRFGERLAVIAERYGLAVIHHAAAWGETIDAATVDAVLGAAPTVDGIWMVHAETSTGVALDLSRLTPVIAQQAPQALIGVDVVTSLGVQELEFDAWGLDVAVSGAQKGLAAPPGLAFTALSERAEARLLTPPPTYTMDLQTILHDQRKGLFTWTPPVTLVAAAHAAVQLLTNAGLESAWDLHRNRHHEIMSWARSHGLPRFGDGTAMGVVALEHHRSEEIRRDLEREAGILIAGGQDQLQGRILRIGTMGYHAPSDLPDLLHLLDTILRST